MCDEVTVQICDCAVIAEGVCVWEDDKDDEYF